MLIKQSVGFSQISQPVLRQMHHGVFDLMQIHALEVIVAVQELIVDRERMLRADRAETVGELLAIPMLSRQIVVERRKSTRIVFCPRLQSQFRRLHCLRDLIRRRAAGRWSPVTLLRI